MKSDPCRECQRVHDGCQDTCLKLRYWVLSKQEAAAKRRFAMELLRKDYRVDCYIVKNINRIKASKRRR